MSTNKIRALIVVVLLYAIAGCAFVPLSSMVKLAAIGRDGIEQIDPSEIRVRVSVSRSPEMTAPCARRNYRCS